MRLVLWNCNGGLGTSEKVDFILGYDADIYILPEIKKNNFEILKGRNSQLGEPVWITNNFWKDNRKKD